MNQLYSGITYPSSFTARNEITGAAIMTGHKNQDLFAVNYGAIKEPGTPFTTDGDFKSDKWSVVTRCESCSLLFRGNASRSLCFKCSK